MADSINPSGEIPDIRKPDLQILLQDLAQSHRDVQEERRNKARDVASERERARWEIEKVRSEAGEKFRELERENEALIRAIGRLQGENDRLREEVAILRVTKNVQEDSKETAKPSDVQGASFPSEHARSGWIGSQRTLPTKTPLVGPAEPPLGKTIPIDPTKL